MDTEQRERFARAAEDLVTELDRLSNMQKKTARHGLSESANSPAKRKCLRCGCLFHSAHAGNRICSGCSIANRAVGLPANFNNAESWG